MVDVLWRFCAQFGFLIAEHLTVPVVYTEPDSVQADLGDADSRLIENRLNRWIQGFHSCFQLPISIRRHDSNISISTKVGSRRRLQ